VYSIWRVKTRARLALARLYLARNDLQAATRHAYAAFRTAKETGATKHQVLALHIRSQSIRRTNPQKAELFSRQAITLARKINAPWLVDLLEAKPCRDDTINDLKT
jgi:hypothetical protein